MANNGTNTGGSNLHLTPIDPPSKRKAIVDHHMVKKHACLSVQAESGLPSLQNTLSGGDLVSFAKPITEAERTREEQIGINYTAEGNRNDDDFINDNNRDQNHIHSSNKPISLVNIASHGPFHVAVSELDNTNMNNSASTLTHYDSICETTTPNEQILFHNRNSPNLHSTTTSIKAKQKRSLVEQSQEDGSQYSESTINNVHSQQRSWKKRQTDEEKIAASIAALQNRQIQLNIQSGPMSMNNNKETAPESEGCRANSTEHISTQSMTQEQPTLTEYMTSAQSVPNIAEGYDSWDDRPTNIVHMEEFLGMIPELTQTPAEEILLKGPDDKPVHFTDFLLSAQELCGTNITDMRVISQADLTMLNETNAGLKYEVDRLYEDNVRLSDDLRKLNEINIQYTENFGNVEQRNAKLGGEFTHLHKLSHDLEKEIKRKNMIIEDLLERIAELEDVVISGAMERNNLEAVLLEKQASVSRYSRVRSSQMRSLTSRLSVQKRNDDTPIAGYDIHRRDTSQISETGLEEQQFRRGSRNTTPSITVAYADRLSVPVGIWSPDQSRSNSYSPRGTRGSLNTSSRRPMLEESQEQQLNRGALIQEEKLRYTGSR
ncbi:hypothetical protein B7463_g7891, partial [Scytalidium lignicola]